jgi:hypothetical protein
MCSQLSRSEARHFDLKRPHSISCQTIQRPIVCKVAPGHEHKPTVFLRHLHSTILFSATLSAPRFPVDHSSVEKRDLSPGQERAQPGFSQRALRYLFN